MNKKAIAVGVLGALLLAGGVAYRLNQANTAAHQEDGHNGEKGGHAEGKEHAEEKGHGEEKGHDEHGEKGHDEHAPRRVKMAAAQQKQSGVEVAAAGKQALAGSIAATGKVEANADRIAHVSPRIPGKIVSVKASLGDGVGAGQVLATLDSVELGEALNRFRQSKTRLSLAQSNLDRVKSLVEKKIAPRKEVQQAESEYETAKAENHTDRERLSLYGLSASELASGAGRPHLPVRAPIAGTITEKHAIVGELSDPAKSLYTIADLSSVWVVVDIHEKDLAKVRRGQKASVAVTAFPGEKFRGRITYLSDQLNEASRTVKARIEVANPGRRLKPEMFASVEVTLAADAPPVLAVPEGAIQEVDGKKLVFVAVSEGEFEPRQVETGRASEGLVEILSGLKEGERYAAKGGFVLKSELKKGEIEGHAH